MKPKISFVVPAYNEEKFIEACLSSIVQAAGTRIDYELIVVDNGSTDDTAKLAGLHTRRVFTIDRSTVSKARNYGAAKAGNDIIAFIDGDVILTSDWVKHFIDQYVTLLINKTFVTGSQCEVPANGTWIERHWFSKQKDRYLGGANIVTSKQVLQSMAGFDESLKTGEDYDFCLRAIAHQFRVIKDNNFKAIHLGFPKTLKAYLRREYWHGEGDFKSFTRLRASAVAQIALFYVVLQLFIVLSIVLQRPTWASTALLVLIAINAAITYKRFKGNGVKTLALNFCLNYLYFCSRAASAFRAYANREQIH